MASLSQINLLVRNQTPDGGSYSWWIRLCWGPIAAVECWSLFSVLTFYNHLLSSYISKWVDCRFMPCERSLVRLSFRISKLCWSQYIQINIFIACVISVRCFCFSKRMFNSAKMLVHCWCTSLPPTFAIHIGPASYRRREGNKK